MEKKRHVRHMSLVSTEKATFSALKWAAGTLYLRFGSDSSSVQVLLVASAAGLRFRLLLGVL